MFQTIEKEHNWTQRERKQLRNISQIISSLMMRKETQDKLEQSQKLMRQLAFYDAIYNIPNRARLNKDLDKIIKRNTKGSLIAFKVTNTRTPQFTVTPIPICCCAVSLSILRTCP